MNIISEIRKELNQLSQNPSNVKDFSRFHKDGKKHIGLVTKIVRNLSAEKYKQVRHLEKKKIYFICEELLETGNHGCQIVAFDWSYRIRTHYRKEDLTVFEKWIDTYVDNWGSCDDVCTHALGYHLYLFREDIPKIRRWTISKNKWKRRASAVVFIYPVKKKKYLDEVFGIAESLLTDEEDLVQKAYGWLLKVASAVERQKVFDFVIQHKNTMPRTALRYAIEKMPDFSRNQALAKD
ncbi:MAG: DNA alkylation repair protein [Spirochaetales bacterium]|nr:DNA alkylation repair protein [Spirochaetales bacterium]